ncbi:MAG: hypothetical protein M1816_005862 [Peltula sp. TS41687]|nr:MAG: hypothetical protein M1816_005862 [Peltula sp. TS41687]
MSRSAKTLAGPGYIILNILRVMNIIALLMVIVASWVMLVKTFVVSKFFFFDAVSHLITSFVGIFLIVSELPLFKSYYTKNWPLLSQSSGLVTLGAAMVVLGVSILGNLNKEATSQESLGTAFWRIVISSGVLVSLLGFLNIIASFIFRDSALDITARQVRAKGAVAAQGSPSTSSHRTYVNEYMSERNSSVRSDHRPPLLPTQSSIGSAGRNDRRTRNPRLPLSISRPINFNEQFADYVQKPNDAHVHHPAYLSEKV